MVTNYAVSIGVKIVLKMTYGSVSFLFMGDANANAESRIANSGTNL
jgi:beta-lactamase superfamily II metal-dependent hydrolase